MDTPGVIERQRPGRPLVVFLMGPTASGKTALAVELVKRGMPDGRGLSIVSVDSAMVYRGMDIGTAKPDAETLAVAPHRLIDIRDPAEPYSAADFRRDALAAIADIHAGGRVPLLVGGTMLYFKALKDGLSALPPADPAIRARLAAELAAQGREVLVARLAAVDPEAAARHGDNPQRLLRALEVFEATGVPLTRLQAEQAPAADPFPFTLLQMAVAPVSREELNRRIAQRFRDMIAAGFLDEVRRLRYRPAPRPALQPDLPALRAVGYRQAWQYLDDLDDGIEHAGVAGRTSRFAGHASYEHWEERGIIATRQLAKRQMTWLRGWQGLHWLGAEGSDPLTQALSLLAEASSSGASRQPPQDLG
jgi:tRNA dimethylallyltransferase